MYPKQVIRKNNKTLIIRIFGAELFMLATNEIAKSPIVQ